MMAAKQSDGGKTMDERIDSLDRFPGNLAEYAQLKNGTKDPRSYTETYAIMDTGVPDKFVMDSDRPLLEILVAQGCVALIHYNPHTPSYGVPVSKQSVRVMAPGSGWNTPTGR